ncbi:histone deacetylase domain-containing protein [Cladorrhinum sp. PSN332]|nr:histone deacetylase domain-containing protein [Cladorrhinum sp. PSN332]
MATKSAPPPSPSREQQPEYGRAPSRVAGQQGGSGVVDGDLTRSLKHLTISTSSPARPSPHSPRPPAIELRPDHQSPNSPTPRRPSSALRSPLNGPPSSATRSPSRSGTPTLLKKASLNSLHSANGVKPLRRASSASILSPTNNNSRSARSPLRAMSPEPPLPTANSIAKEHFQRELEGMEKALDGPPNTLVILQDDCYGHRYSRPRTSKRDLATIVERPERLRACVLGISAAYVRLGGRYDGGPFPIEHNSSGVASPIPFLIKKSDRGLPLTSESVTNVHGTKWMEELVLMCQTAQEKLALNGKELERPEMSRGPDAEPPRKFHEGDLYLCPESLRAMEGAMGGVCDAVDAVFGSEGPKRAFVAIRPPGHHCSADYPSGFCWVNNVHVGIMHAGMVHGLTHAAIIDIDLHHGDGSQEIAWQHNARRMALSNTSKFKNAPNWKKMSIGYFSLHDINSFPCEFGDPEKVRNASICIDNAHGQNICNVHLQPWEKEAEFWDLYNTKYSVLLEKTRQYLRQHTAYLRSMGLASKGAIFISAGFDASEHEDEGMRRHKVNVPTEFYARITRDIAKIAEEEETGVDGRLVSVLEGGYSDRTLCSGVLSHICGLVSPESESGSPKSNSVTPCSPSWWSRDELVALETVLGTVPMDVKRPRAVTPPTYSSPTHASTARAAVPPKNIRRSVSGLPEYRLPTPPPPEVPWTVAAVELSKLLIPGPPRTTTSCTPDDLKVRRDRQLAPSQERPTSSASVAPAVVVDRAPTRMSLRERKARPSAVVPAVTAPERKPRQSRRLSAASTIVSENREPTPPPPVPRPTPVKVIARPNSAQSNTTANGTIIVKKTRAKKPESAPKAPKTPAVTPRLNDGLPESDTVMQTPKSTPGRKNSSPDRMSSLTNDVKKIKITVISKSEKEAREQARAAIAESIAVSSPTDSENTKPSASSPVDSTEDTTLVPGFSSPTFAVLPSSSPLLSPTDTGFSSSLPSTPYTGRQHVDTPMPKGGDRVFKQYRPDGAVSEALKRFEYQQQPLTWVAPNSDILPGVQTPVKGPTPMKKEDLPVFGSTGAIPFSPHPPPPPPVSGQQETNVGDVVEKKPADTSQS